MTRGILPAYSPVGLAPLLGSFRAFASHRFARSQLQERLREGFGADRVYLLETGTQSLQLAIESTLAGVDASSRSTVVALPAYGCFDLASAVVGAHAQVLFYDLDPETLVPDRADLERVLAMGVAAVIVAPLWGYQPDWDALKAQVHGHGAVLIEDAAQSHGSTWRGRSAGTFGDLSILSFGRGKGWTSGRGGALLTRGPCQIRNVDPGSVFEGLGAVSGAAASWMLGRPIAFAALSRIPRLGLGETRYVPPRDIRGLSAAAAELALGTKERSDVEAAFRKGRAQQLTALVGNDRLIRVCQPQAGGSPGYLRLPALLAGGAAKLQDVGGADLVGAGVRRGYPKILPELKPIEPYRVAPGDAFPGARRLVDELITLPTHSRSLLIHPQQFQRLGA